MSAALAITSVTTELINDEPRAVFSEIRPDLEALGRMGLCELNALYEELTGDLPYRLAFSSDLLADLRGEIARLLIRRAVARLSPQPKE